MIIDLFLIFLFLFIVTALVAPWARRYYEQKKSQSIIQSIEGLFRDINPFAISKKAREALPNNPADLVYGEIDLTSFLNLLAKVHPQPHQVFYDMGSGCGKALMAAKLRYPTLQVKGIETLAPLHHMAQQKWQAYCQQHPLSAQGSLITFICDNWLQQNIQDADIILVNATALSTAAWQQAVEQLIPLKQGLKIITTSKTLPSPLFNLKYQGMELMSWGLTSTYIYEKIK